MKSQQEIITSFWLSNTSSMAEAAFSPNANLKIAQLYLYSFSRQVTKCFKKAGKNKQRKLQSMALTHFKLKKNNLYIFKNTHNSCIIKHYVKVFSYDTEDKKMDELVYFLSNSLTTA